MVASTELILTQNNAVFKIRVIFLTQMFGFLIYKWGMEIIKYTNNSF